MVKYQTLFFAMQLLTHKGNSHCYLLYIGLVRRYILLSPTKVHAIVYDHDTGKAPAAAVAAVAASTAKAKQLNS